MPQFHIVSLFPEFFQSPMETALMGRARAAGIVACDFYNPRDFSTNKHHHVDDRPYGGGPGMVMQGEPLAAALRAIPSPGRMLVMTPAGRPVTQRQIQQWAQEDDVTLICGRYEGLDQRLYELFPLEPVCVGDLVLNGGETAALTIMEAVARLLPGFMGKEASGEEESFSQGLLEYPHYTRPDCLEGLEVPEVLRQGDHGAIARWRREASLRLTERYRPDLLETAPLTREDAAILARIPRTRAGRNLSFCLMHAPVMLDARNCGVSSLTNLDIHDIARLSCSYAMGPFYVVTPLEEQQRLLHDILRHWTSGAGSKGNPDRAKALSMVRPARTLDDALEDLTQRTGVQPRLVSSSAVWPEGKKAPPPLCCADVLDWCREGPVMLCLGTAHGLAPEILARSDGQLRPVRFLQYNHLSVRSAASIIADRILGDFQ